MSNIIDYIKWRGDLSFEASGFNEVDGLLFSLLSYIDWSDAVDQDYHDSITLKDAASILLQKEDLCHMLAVDNEKYREVLDLCSKSVRFSSIKLLHYINKYSPEIQMQFAAIVFEINNTLVFSFRGTDDTFTGWQEDFNMSILKTVPSQSEALAYFIGTSNRFTKHDFILCGHSKGGNLAVFSAVMSPEVLSDRIRLVYSYDGPGFMSSNNDAYKYKKIVSRITTFVPQSSIVGMFLDHEEKHVVIKSTASNGLAQHNGLTWEVLGNSFEHLEDTDKRSKFLEMTFKNAIANTSVEEREKLAEALSQVFEMMEADTLTDVKRNIPASVAQFVKGYDSLSDSSKRIISFTFRTVISSRKQTSTSLEISDNNSIKPIPQIKQHKLEMLISKINKNFRR
ncbi:MAG: DUF2974 domain-containing protein [Clostridia bacterium]|nr:DUF2974 domain-containing protein [Clostridia bacterium]